MEIKIDMNGSDVELAAFLRGLTINHSQKEETGVKTANTKKKGRPKKAVKVDQNQPRRMTSWMIRKWPTSEITFSRTVIRMFAQKRKEKERALIAGDASAEAAPWATDAQRRWQELGRRRVLAARVPYRHHEELDKDIQEARRRGLSYGYWMARKTGILL